jgi:hypothetical protein
VAAGAARIQSRRVVWFGLGGQTGTGISSPRVCPDPL